MIKVSYSEARAATKGVILDEVDQAYEIFNEAFESEPFDNALFALSTVYAAGIIAGVRQERARRRKKSSANGGLLEQTY